MDMGYLGEELAKAGYCAVALQRFIGLPEERGPGMERQLVAKVGRDMALKQAVDFVSGLDRATAKRRIDGWQAAYQSVDWSY